MSDSNVVQIPPAPKKYRTVTLTNARPVSFVEEDWPVIAEGRYDWSREDGMERIAISFRVRQHKRRDWNLIVHGKFEHSHEIHEFYDQVRVGRVINDQDLIEKTLLELGEEMRERIARKDNHALVTQALDSCFAGLGPAILP